MISNNMLVSFIVIVCMWILVLDKETRLRQKSIGFVAVLTVVGIAFYREQKGVVYEMIIPDNALMLILSIAMTCLGVFIWKEKSFPRYVRIFMVIAIVFIWVIDFITFI